MRRIKDNDKISRGIEKAYNAKKYVVSYRSVYQPFYSKNAGYYAREVYRSNDYVPLTLAGRYFHMTGKEINRMIRMELLNNL